jgi:hypothetical protein
MKRLFFLFLITIVLSGCVSTRISFNGQQIYKLDSVFEDTGFFLYPQDAVVVENPDSVAIKFDFCEVVLSKKTPLITPEVDVNTKHSDGFTLSSWFLDDVLVGYLANIDDSDYVFYLNTSEKYESSCLTDVELLAKSFSLNDKYVNTEYGYTVDFVNDFKIGEFKNNGFKMFKKLCDIECENDKNTETNEQDIVEMSVSANRDNGQMNDYVYENYEGYTIEFTNLGVLSVAFVDEIKDGMAVRHCFIFKDGVRYEFILKVSSLTYSEYKSVFDDFCFTFEKV